MTQRPWSRRSTWATAALCLLAASVPVSAQAQPLDRFVETIDPAHRVAVFTDSVGLGAEYAIPRAFPDGWEVNVDGAPARFVGKMETEYVRPRLTNSPHWFGDHVVIGAGYNFTFWDHERFNREVDSMVATLTNAGVKHVHWVTLREVKPQYISASAWRQIQPYYWYFPTVNDLLEQALERHPNLHLVDWAAAADRTGLTYDAIHLNNTGADLYAALIRASVDAVATAVPDGSTTRVHVPDSNGAAAAAINVTTTAPRTAGFITAHPCGTTPNVSMHNYVRAQVVAHSSIVALDANGDFCLTTRVATNLIVDVTGVFRADGGFGILEPTRWLDTRISSDRAPVEGGTTIELHWSELGDEADAPDAVALSVTAAAAAGPGFLVVHTCGVEAATSNVNFLDASPSPNNVVVELDETGRICVYASETTHVLVDLIGAFVTDETVSAAAPVRWFDSRLDGAKVAADSVTRLTVDSITPGAAADAGDELRAGLILNVTGVAPEARGYITAYPCADGQPGSSNLNLTSAISANAVIIEPDEDGAVCFYSLTSAHLIVDVMGHVDDTFTGFRPVRVLDTRDPSQ